MKKRTTIFRQLILNVVLPAVAALIILGVLNFHQTNKILKEANETKNRIITEEIKHIHEMQDLALDLLEDHFDPWMRKLSNLLANEYFIQTGGIDTVNLEGIRLQTGMDPDQTDIYIINRLGKVVNTTFEEDMNLNFFDFGIEHENMLKEVFKGGHFYSERFAVESGTKRLRKYTYQPTYDGRYIIELGVYSPQADSIIGFIKKRINDLAKRQESIVSVDLFIGKDYPVSLNKSAEIDPMHLTMYENVLRTRSKAQLVEKKNGKLYHYEYIFMGRKNTDLYSESVIRIISDRTSELELIRTELLKFFIIFAFTMFFVVLLLYRRTRVITDPIKKLVDKVNRISNGHMSERAEVEGNNEIASLSEQFNQMIEQLESYYYELEEMVKDRTAEIQTQKEEIEAQRDSIREQRNILSEINRSLQDAYIEIEEQKKHIEDSIHYARRIQNAILPPDDYVNKLLPESFVYYRPKDIVSGDFYWINTKNGKIQVAAVDCTGHGVPGAFMSIVGNNQLNYAVNVKGAERPDEILNALNEGVTKALRQTRISASVKDGMDIALVNIDMKNKKLQYAGAYNPLYFIHKGELIQVKADKFPIGGYMGEKLKSYTSHEFDFQKGDMIYIFSDGFADQFGGDFNRKYLIKRFRELLFRIHSEPMGDQREILNQIYEDWKGEGPQIDDILVIGIRL